MYAGGGHVKNKKFVIADLELLPPVYHRVLFAKELLESGKAATINEAVKIANVSRSAYYKYKESVFPFNHMQGILTLLAVVIDVKGVLSSMLGVTSEAGCNILTINQNVPVNGVANITLTLQTDRMKISVESFITQLKSIHGVRKIDILARQ